MEEMIMKMNNKEEFDKVSMFSTGAPNEAFAK